MHAGTQVGLEGLLGRMGRVLLLLFAAQVGLEDAGRAHGQEVFVDDGLGLGQAAGDQRVQVGRGGRCGLACGQGGSLVAQREAVEGQVLPAQLLMGVGESLEDLGQAAAVVGCGTARAAHVAHLGQQLVVERAALARERHAALLDLAEARRVRARARGIARKTHGLLERLEAGLAQQDGAGAARRAFDHVLGVHAALGHGGLGRVDVQGARRQVVDVRALEADHVGDQAVGLVQRVVGGAVHGGLAVPAEGLQRLADEFIGLGIGEAAVGLGLGDQRQRALGEDVAARQDGGGLGAQRLVGNQVQAQQRGEDAERVGQQRGIADGTEGRGVHGHAGHRQVVVAHGLHAHDGEQAAQHGQLGGRAHADGAVALHAQAGQLATALHPGQQLRLGLQRALVDVGHEFDQRAVLGHFIAVHLGHGAGKARADLVGRHEGVGGRRGHGACGD